MAHDILSRISEAHIQQGQYIEAWRLVQPLPPSTRLLLLLKLIEALHTTTLDTGTV